jgi:hypothetical protein
MHWFLRHWPWLPPSRRELIAIIAAMLLLAAVLAAMIKFPHLRFGMDNSFGPDWDCSPTPHGGCVKRVPPAAVPEDFSKDVAQPK